MRQAFAPTIKFEARTWLLWERTLYSAATGNRLVGALLLLLLPMMVIALPLLPILFVLSLRSPVAPTGMHRVGVRDVETVVSDDAGGESKLLRVRVFYPASASVQPPWTSWFGIGQWLPSGHASKRYALAHTVALPLPAWLKPWLAPLGSFLRLARLPSGVCRDATPAKATQWPVTLFSHGLCGCCASYSAACAELASHGTVVLAVEHKDGSAIYTETSDGHIVEYSSGGGEADSVAQPARRTDELLAVARQAAAVASLALKGTAHVDAARVSLVGHSFGGAAVLRAASALAGEPRAMPAAVSSAEQPINGAAEVAAAVAGVVRSVVALDPWLVGGARCVLTERGAPTAPTLCLLTQSMSAPPPQPHPTPPPRQHAATSPPCHPTTARLSNVY